MDITLQKEAKPMEKSRPWVVRVLLPNGNRTVWNTYKTRKAAIEALNGRTFRDVKTADSL